MMRPWVRRRPSVYRFPAARATRKASSSFIQQISQTLPLMPNLFQDTQRARLQQSQCQSWRWQSGSTTTSSSQHDATKNEHSSHPKSTSSNPNKRRRPKRAYFNTNKALQRARLKGELRPMLGLALHSFLGKKLQALDHDNNKNMQDAMSLLAPWNGFQPLSSSQIVVKERLPLGAGLIAEASALASENYIVLARLSSNQQHISSQHGKSSSSPSQSKNYHPPFYEEDASWYKALESNINGRLDRWEDNARQRRQQGLHTAKTIVQRGFDSVQAPLAKGFEMVTAKVGPVVEQVRQNFKKQLLLNNNNKPDPIATMGEETQDSDKSPDMPSKHNAQTEADSSAAMECEEDAPIKPIKSEKSAKKKVNRTELEDLIILTKDGSTLLLLQDVHPLTRLLALPTITSVGTRGRQKVQHPYRLRMVKGGLVITCSVVALGAIPPTYRSLRFILDYPRTAEIVMISLVVSIGYSLWSWRTGARTRQHQLIATALQSRMLARNEAAITHLKEGAVQCLTEVVMEDYVSLLLQDRNDGDDENEQKQQQQFDPLVMEIGLVLGLFHSPQQSVTKIPIMDSAHLKRYTKPQDIQAVPWEEARASLVHQLAKRM